jgi:transketolase
LTPHHAKVRQLASRIRLHAARMVAKDGLGYLGQALSSAELLATLFASFFRPGRDHFVLSPGHYAIGVFAAAAEMGWLDPAELTSYAADGSRLEAIGSERSPIVDLTCGSLGQGLSGAVGLALSDRLRARDGRTFAFLSDGEMEEGQVWEAAMFAAHHRLHRLIAVCDCNNSQVDGPVDTVTTLEPIADRWRAFGWAAIEVDGHDVSAISDAIEAAADGSLPTVIVARTDPQRGVTALPEEADLHFVKLPQELAESVLRELEAQANGA